MDFIFYSEFGEALDLASYLANVRQHYVVMYIQDKASRSIGKGIVTHTEEWFDFLGKGLVWVFDSCTFGRLQDWLRSRGELVFGGCEDGDELENNRQLNQEWFKELGFKQPFSKNFTSLQSARKFIEKHSSDGKRYIMKQNGDAPKSINHLGKFDGGIDMLFHLDELEKSWNVQEYGPIDFDLMEVVEGLEVAASAFFNGSDFLRDGDGRIAGYLNFEEKKEANGGTGETCGEMGTTFIGTNDSHRLFNSIIGRPGIVEKLRDIGFHGVFDINCIVDMDDPKGIVALEPTMRFGIPATSYEMIEGMVSDPAEVIEACARGTSLPEGLQLHEGIGMVMCVVAKPFPCEMDVEEKATSLGERLWILNPKDGQPSTEGFSEDQREHIHLYNFEHSVDNGPEGSGESCYKVVTKNGYLLTVTGQDGSSIKQVRKNLIEYIKDNLYLSGMKYRTDVGGRIEEQEESLL
jgi:phosphoribosylamine-glycine ligase